MDLVHAVLSILDNGSVAAFLGAFFAFVLIVATDRRRRRHRYKVFRRFVVDCISAAGAKRAEVTSIRNLLRDHDRIQPGEVRRFPLSDLNAVKLEVLDMFTAEEGSALELLLFRMDGANNLLGLIHSGSEALYGLYIEKQVGEDAQRIKRKLLVDFEAAIANLSTVETLGQLYLSGRYNEVSKWQSPEVRAEDILANGSTT